MRVNQIIAIIIVALASGFGLAWWLKPSEPHPDHSIPGSSSSAEEATYTCSMHPQIRQEEPGKCPICGMDLIPAGEAKANDPLVLEMTPEAVRLAQVETSLIGTGHAPDRSIALSGKIVVDERRSASQVSHFPGRIEKLWVTFTGETVREGQPLALLYSPELLTAQEELIDAYRFRETQPELLAAARKKLYYWKIPQEKVREIEESGTPQENLLLQADESGVVRERKVAVGDYVGEGQVLFELADLDRLWVQFDAYEKDLAKIRIGDRISFTTPALPGRTFSTRITFIDPVIHPETRVASVRGEIDNRTGLLKPEMFVNGTLQGHSVGEDRLLVPASAVLWTGPRSVVYVKLPGAKVPSYRFREVQLGERVGAFYELESGLESGEEVVTHGNFAIDAAAQLNNQASMMNRDIQVSGKRQEEALPDYTEDVPEAFKAQLYKSVRSYLKLKEALVATQSGLAREEAGHLVNSLNAYDGSLAESPARDYWMEKLASLRSHSEKIAGTAEIKVQRQQFGFLSDVLIQTVRAFGIPGDSLFVQHCPMAFDNRGGDWLSEQRVIRNPYFGDQMLSCGTVELTITPDFQNPAPQEPRGQKEHRH